MSRLHCLDSFRRADQPDELDLLHAPALEHVGLERGGEVVQRVPRPPLQQVDDPEEEPAKKARWNPADNPLFGLDNVLVTPHTAYYSEQSIALARETACSEVRRVLSGERPRNPVNNVRLASGEMSLEPPSGGGSC